MVKLMENEKVKKKNRLISFMFLGVFLSSIVLMAIVTTDIVTTYVSNAKLEKKKKELKEELDYIGGTISDASEGYYIIYSCEDYVIESNNGEVIIVYEMK